jgi:septal ring factor EnvC (AmiA/AmiB activator)
MRASWREGGMLVLTKKQYYAMRRQHQVLKDRRAQLKDQRNAYQNAIAAIEEELAEVDDEEQLYTQQLKSLTDEYERANNR